jgi:hypothetical protein
MLGCLLSIYLQGNHVQFLIESVYSTGFELAARYSLFANVNSLFANAKFAFCERKIIYFANDVLQKQCIIKG